MTDMDVACQQPVSPWFMTNQQAVGHQSASNGALSWYYGRCDAATIQPPSQATSAIASVPPSVVTGSDSFGSGRRGDLSVHLQGYGADGSAGCARSVYSQRQISNDVVDVPEVVCTNFGYGLTGPSLDEDAKKFWNGCDGMQSIPPAYRNYFTPTNVAYSRQPQTSDLLSSSGEFGLQNFAHTSAHLNGSIRHEAFDCWHLDSFNASMNKIKSASLQT
jgi:hypothetical protein